jgi:starch synthase
MPWRTRSRRDRISSSCPLVRATGGLEDTIQDYNPKTGRGTGFKFQNYSSRDFLETVRKALAVYQDRKSWKRLMIRGMKADFSWQRAAREYMSLYGKAKAHPLIEKA